MEPVVITDLVTTGPDPYEDEIVNIAAVRYEDGRITARFSELSQPGKPVPLAVTKRTGISGDTVRDARPLESVVPDYMKFVTDDALCVMRDRDLGRAFLRRASGDTFKHTPLDLREFAAVCFPSLPGYDMEDLLEELGPVRPELLSEHAQWALADCEYMAGLWELLVKQAGSFSATLVAEIDFLLSSYRNHPVRTVFQELHRLRQGKPRTNVAALFRQESVPRPRKELPDASTYTPLDTEELAGLFGRDGAFAASVSGYELREEQVEMTRAVTQALNDSKHLMVEAGTGIGKSLAYLTPAVMWAAANRTPVVISTNTKNLQHQLYHKDLPQVRKVLDTELKTAIIKGRKNYLCLRKLGYALRHAGMELDGDEPIRLAGLLVWASTTATGDLSECSVCNGGALGQKVSSVKEECPGPECSCRRRCFLYRARRHTLAADLIVTNHAVVFAEMGMEDSSPVLPPYAHVVFDEAHNLEDAAVSAFSTEISMFRLQSILRTFCRRTRRRRGRGLVASIMGQAGSSSYQGAEDLRGRVLRFGPTLTRNVSEAESEAEPLFAALKIVLGGKQTVRIRGNRKREADWRAVARARGSLVSKLAEVKRAAETILEALEGMEDGDLRDRDDFAQNLKAGVEWLDRFTEDMEYVLDAGDETCVYWLERARPGQGGVRAWGAPVQLGERLSEELYSGKSSVIFTSATLSVRNSFGFVSKRLGIDLIKGDRLVEMNAGSPFDYPRQCMIIVPTFLPEPGDAERSYAEELAVLLGETFRRTRGRAMGLFTSYDMLRKTTSVLRDEMAGDPYPVLAQGESGSRENLTRIFKRNHASVLMGTHSFWEGVDVVGDSLSCLVVARLPFAVFTDPVIEARCEQVEAEGESAFLGYSVPNAVIRLRQGFGRLIRHRNDRGIVIIADRRIVTKRYGDWFQSSLPAPLAKFQNREQFLDAIEQFLGNEG
ncbi:helicase C-terminal domain-containing protein [Verrucomicrobiota bacterium]